MIPIFISHYTKNIDRRVYLEKILRSTPYDTIWVTTQDASDQNNRFKIHYDIANTISSYERRVADTIRQLYIQLAHQLALIENSGIIRIEHYERTRKYLASLDKATILERYARGMPSLLNKSVVSLSLKQRYAYSLFLLRQEVWGLFLEDDVILTDHSLPGLNSLIRILETNELFSAKPTYIDLGGGCGLEQGSDRKLLHVYGTSSLFKLEVPCSRTTCAYIANKEFVVAFLKQRQMVTSAIDSEITGLMGDNDKNSECHALWMQKPLFIHGSESGVYNSSVRH